MLTISAALVFLLGLLTGDSTIGELRVQPEFGQDFFLMGPAETLPGGLNYRFSNAGDRQFDYELRCDVPWLKLSRTKGRLQPQGRAEVKLRIDHDEVQDLAPGWHETDVEFINLTNGNGDCKRTIRFLMRGQQGLAVARLSGQAHCFELINQSATPIAWVARAGAEVLRAVPSDGSLDAGASVEVQVELTREAPAKAKNLAVAFLNRTDGVGNTARSLHFGSAPVTEPDKRPRAEAKKLRSIQQYGITWTFAEPSLAGQYANGDWWVLGPALLIDIAPRSSSKGERQRNGSMLNPSPKYDYTQGYDSAAYGKYKGDDSYKPRLNVARDVSLMRPLLLRANNSLVSTISMNEAGVRPQIKTAAILTCVQSVPPAGAFRPPYAGHDKRSRFTESQLRTDLLARIKVPPSTPKWRDVERMFERPWIAHVPRWVGHYLHPSENMENYGREISDQVSTAALMLHMDVSLEKKHKLLVRFVQLGIDLHGLLLDGGFWKPDGGHMSGRKWPILFAGLMLGDAQMQSIGVEYEAVTFGEDGQTFYVEQVRPELGYGPEQKGLPEWGVQHARKPQNDDARWRHTEDLKRGMKKDDLRTHDLKYRLCCTANTWWGQLLAARIMGAQELWNHPALFDYQDRFFEENVKRKIFNENMSLSKFTLQMWRRYRKDY